jgi:aspartyl-tRNA(Asn)/glutamyl-tRNA(Gln) amidotransferase subunit C
MKEIIEKLAALSRVALTPAEVEKMTTDIESILGYVSEIQQVSGEAPQPTAGALRNVMRTDAVTHERGQYKEVLIKAMPKSENGYLKVKKILGS